MYLEISNVAAALGKNPYESKEKTLLVSWARHCPDIVREYLINHNCIIPLKENEDSYTDLQVSTCTSVLPEKYDVNDFKKIENDVVEEYKRKRNNEQTEEEIVNLKLYTNDLLKKDNGNNQEINIIKKEKYTKGNDKMYYYKVTDKGCIGGKNDATDEDILIEIKTRTRIQNVRRNEYDLYQLICYLLATNKNKGKIVQLYNKTKYDSDEASEIEYGIVDINMEPWKQLSIEIIEGLKTYFNQLSELINTGNYLYLNNVIPLKCRPIAKYFVEKDDVSDKEYFKVCEDNIKFKNLFRHITN